MPVRRCHRRELRALVLDLAALAGVITTPDCQAAVEDLLENAVINLTMAADRLRQHGRRLTLTKGHVQRAVRNIPVRLADSPFLSSVCRLSGVVEQDFVALARAPPPRVRTIKGWGETRKRLAKDRKAAEAKAKVEAAKPRPSPKSSPGPKPAPPPTAPVAEAGSGSAGTAPETEPPRPKFRVKAKFAAGWRPADEARADS